MNLLEREQKEQELFESLLNKAQEAIEQADEMVCDRLNAAEHASENMKDAQRLSNAILRVKQSMDLVKYEI